MKGFGSNRQSTQGLFNKSRPLTTSNAKFKLNTKWFLEYEMMSSSDKGKKNPPKLLELEYYSEVPAHHKILNEMTNSTVFLTENEYGAFFLLPLCFSKHI